MRTILPRSAADRPSTRLRACTVMGVAMRAMALARRWIETPLPDPDTRYLARAADHADLERRLRLVEQPTRSAGALWFWL